MMDTNIVNARFQTIGMPTMTHAMTQVLCLQREMQLQKHKMILRITITDGQQ